MLSTYVITGGRLLTFNVLFLLSPLQLGPEPLQLSAELIISVSNKNAPTSDWIFFFTMSS